MRSFLLWKAKMENPSMITSSHIKFLKSTFSDSSYAFVEVLTFAGIAVLTGSVSPATSVLFGCVLLIPKHLTLQQSSPESALALHTSKPDIPFCNTASHSIIIPCTPGNLSVFCIKHGMHHKCLVWRTTWCDYIKHYITHNPPEITLFASLSFQWTEKNETHVNVAQPVVREPRSGIFGKRAEDSASVQLPSRSSLSLIRFRSSSQWYHGSQMLSGAMILLGRGEECWQQGLPRPAFGSFLTGQVSAGAFRALDAHLFQDEFTWWR